MIQSYWTLTPFVAAVLTAAITGNYFRPGTWYANLDKPPWTPPGWLFGPAWACLYVAIAVAGWTIWQQAGLHIALAIWVIQLGVNAAWSWVMFGRREIGAAMLTLCCLWLLVAAFAIVSWSVSPSASQLFWPYLAWVTFAGALNFSIWRRNRNPLSA
jgi:translocator protein